MYLQVNFKQSVLCNSLSFLLLSLYNRRDTIEEFAREACSRKKAAYKQQDNGTFCDENDQLKGEPTNSNVLYYVIMCVCVCI